MADATTPSVQHLYVHVPFCRRRCSYCDFAISVRQEIPAHEFRVLIARELHERLKRDHVCVGPLRTLYLGGGTPSLLGGEGLARLVEDLIREVGCESNAEVTIEANPEDVTPEAMTAWSQAGINRVSVGVQSLQDDVLQWMHRSHTAEQALASLEVATSCPAFSVSADVIFAIPQRLGAVPVQDLTRIVETGVQHISVYGLTAEPHTPFSKWLERGEIVEASVNEFRKQFFEVHSLLSNGGFDHYEVSNFSKLGHQARHNTAYWTGANYLGLGPSAHSFVAGRRTSNVPNWTAYRDRVKQGIHPTAMAEDLSNDQRRLERVYLALRTTAGLSMADGLVPAPKADRLIQTGWLAAESGILTATLEGWLRLDEIVPFLTA